MSEFSGKTVLITGAAGGFGRLLAARLDRDGAHLVLGDLDEPSLATLASGLTHRPAFMRCDVTREGDQRQLVELAASRFGRLDIAINNAGGTSPMKGFLETTEEDIDWNFRLNAKGVFFGMKHQISQMINNGGGSILNVASVAGISGAPKNTAYCAAKHAVVGMTRTAAVEYAKKNVRVNAICPYFSPTPLMTKSNMIERRAQLEAAVPLKRLAEPEEVVAAMLSIVLPSNSYLTGQAIAVDGGISAF
ncbi:MAG: SDR family NAD(P)-dependent oxidoreductase [Dehalococcoidia bacterium]